MNYFPNKADFGYITTSNTDATGIAEFLKALSLMLQLYTLHGSHSSNVCKCAGMGIL